MPFIFILLDAVTGYSLDSPAVETSGGQGVA